MHISADFTASAGEFIDVTPGIGQVKNENSTLSEDQRRSGIFWSRSRTDVRNAQTLNHGSQGICH